MDLKAILDAVHDGDMPVDQAMEHLKTLPYGNLGFARVDHHRALRQGFPEVIFCAGKTPEQTAAIAADLVKAGQNVLGTRAGKEHFDAVHQVLPDAIYNECAHTITYVCHQPRQLGEVAVCTGGTADIPVAEEAAITLEALGCTPIRLYDIGIAGIHRLLDKLDVLRSAKVIVAVAGMEGALAGVIGGLVDRPVVAVPTSVGYGANFGGLSALLTMLNTCAAGIGIVNIDNGFGGGYLAAQISRLAADMQQKGKKE